MKKKMRETKMRPVKAWAIVNTHNGEIGFINVHQAVVTRTYLRDYSAKGWHIVPVLIKEIPRKKKV